MVHALNVHIATRETGVPLILMEYISESTLNHEIQSSLGIFPSSIIIYINSQLEDYSQQHNILIIIHILNLTLQIKMTSLPHIKLLIKLNITFQL